MTVIERNVRLTVSTGNAGFTLQADLTEAEVAAIIDIIENSSSYAPINTETEEN